MAKIVRAAIFVLLVTSPLAVQAGQFDTEYLFGFVTGTDVGEVGEKEFESETNGKFRKRTGSYSALSQTNAIEFVPVQGFRVEVGAAFDYHNIAGVAELDSLRRSAFQGLSVDLRYQLFDRGRSPFGFTVQAVPRWGRIDDISGQPVDQYGSEFAFLFDFEPVPDRIVAAFNLLYEPETTRSRINGAWSQDSIFGVSTAAMALVQPGFLFGAEARYLRAYDSLGFGSFAGQALFFGPNVFMKPSERWRITAAWSFQIAGKAINDPASLDLTHFIRQEVKVRIGYAF